MHVMEFFSQAYNKLQHLVRFLDSSEGEEDINLELEQLHRRNKIGPSCYPQASSWMIASGSRRFGVLGGKDVLEDQNLSLMKDYNEIKDLPIQNGFAGDEICQKMTANVDLWETYIKIKIFGDKSGDEVYPSWEFENLIREKKKAATL